MIKNIYIVGSINTLETCLTGWLFHYAMPNLRGAKHHTVLHQVARCDGILARLSDPALCCGIAVNMCFLFMSKRVRRMWVRLTEWVFGTGTHLSLPFFPQSRQPEPGQTRQSPAGHSQLTHQGLDGKMPGALIKLMLFVYLFGMDESITALQEFCESHILSGEPWALATGVLREGCVLS